MITLFDIQIMFSDIQIMSKKRKINYYCRFLSRGTSRLTKWIYQERYELLLLKRKQQLNNSLQTTKLISCKLCFQFTVVAICTTQVKKREQKRDSKNRKKIVTKNLLHGDLKPEPQNQLELKVNAFIHLTTKANASLEITRGIYSFSMVIDSFPFFWFENGIIISQKQNSVKNC